MQTINEREIEYEIDDIFPNRWSPRAMSGESVTDKGEVRYNIEI